MTAGTVYAIDLDPGMVAATAARAASLGLGNVRTVERDFDADGTGLPDRSVRFAMLFNLLHTEAPLRMLREARRVLAPGGKLAIITGYTTPQRRAGPSSAFARVPSSVAAGSGRWGLRSWFHSSRCRRITSG
jgi:ubiquinone/menaquinone biosynthesis C-methylase UbiE